MKALQTVGFRRSVQYVLWAAAYKFIYPMLFVPPLRAFGLRLAGATIGRHTVVMDLRLFNLDRGGLRGLRIGRDCFIGDECLFDMAVSITLGDQVTLAERVIVLTHTNVGYPDHPLQAEFPASTAPVTIRDGCYIGAGAIILPGVTIGPRTAIGAGSVVTRDIEGGVVAAGTPARATRALTDRESAEGVSPQRSRG
jgi:maltose O-acetyltransferase